MEEKRYIKRKERAIADGNREQIAISCNHLGDYYNQQGKYANAVKEYAQEADIYKKLGKQLEMAKACRMVGEMFMLLSEFDNAKDHIQTYLKTVKNLKNKVEEQRAYATLGRAFLLHGQSLTEVSTSSAVEQLKQAEKSFLRSLLLIKELSGKISKLEQLDMQARCYLNIGVVKEHMEEFEESISYIEKAIRISKTHDIFELTHLCYISMSLLYHCKKNDPTLALRYCNLALDVAKRLPNKVKKICETLITKAEILIKEGDFASAKQILTKAYKKNTSDENDRTTIEKSLRIVVKICQLLDELVTTSSDNYPLRKSIYEKLGDGCCHLNNYAKALEYYQKMLDCALLNAETGKQLIPIYVSLYQTYKDNKQYDKSLEYLWKEFELNKDVPFEAFSTLCTIGDVCELQSQSFWTIQDIYLKAKEKAVEAGDSKKKLLKIAYARLKKVLVKHKMNTLLDELIEEANSNGIDLLQSDDDSDTESDPCSNNTPEMGEEICLDDLTDSDSSDLDESEKYRPHRMTRGIRCLTLKRNNKGETQLHQACISGNLELVRRLLDQGHVVNVRDHAGWIPLHEACNHGFRDIVEILLNRGALIAINDKGGTSCDGITPLYDACSNGFLDVVELLLEKGADATLKTDFGDTCLNALDKWRRTAILTDDDHVLYTKVRTDIAKRLSNVGISGNCNSAPLTNSHALVVNDETSSDISLHSSDDDNDDSALSITLKTPHGKNQRSNGKTALQNTETSNCDPSRATLHYKFVMEHLKHPNRANTMDDELIPGTSSASLKQKRSALLESEEIDVDSWLINDVGPEKKKRRFYTPKKQNKNLTISDLNEPSCSEVESDLSVPRTLNSNLSGSGQCINSKFKHQTSLFDSGFCRFRSESPILNEDPAIPSKANYRSAEPDSTTSIQIQISPVKSSPVKIQTIPYALSTVSFKIKVEDELLLVPIDRKKINDINIRWLAEEAARRYYNMVGLKPVLRLKTSDGFAYEENDPVSVAVEENMILATVTELKMLPLSQRYEEMCLQLSCENNPRVLTVLQNSELSNNIVFNNSWLTKEITIPIFKSILHQNNIRILNLSNNFIQNDGCRQLAKSLPTLKHLQKLNLRGNLITSEGLEALCVAEISKLEQFEELDLSQNALSNSSMRILEKFCQMVSKSLKKLFLSNCNLTNVYDFDLNYFHLTDFDISFNNLSEISFKKLLSKLNCCRLQGLNLSYTIKPTERAYNENGFIIANFFESGTCEKFKIIKLSGCNLKDSNMISILQCIQKSNEIDILDVSENPQLTWNSLKYILDEVPQLKKIVAFNCTQLIREEHVERLSQYKNFPNVMAVTIDDSKISNDFKLIWQSHWGKRGKSQLCGLHLKLYVNDNDIDGI